MITRYVADVLGFTHRLRSEKNPKAEFFEDEIYQHFTKCQTFLASGVDETKRLSRRTAFTNSMQFLYGLAETGQVIAVSRWSPSNGKDDDPETKMKRFGMKRAESALGQNKDISKAAASLLLIALDGAYNSVLAVRIPLLPTLL